MKLSRMILTAVLILVFVSSSAMALCVAAEYRSGENSYITAQKLAAAEAQAAPERETESVLESLAPSLPEEPELMTLAAESMLRIPVRESEQAEAAISDIHAVWLAELDLKALQEVNPEVIGWIFIPGTCISYPIVQGTDNQYYLEHTWDRQESAMGAVFMESTNAADFSDFSTILYGHNLRSGAMFTSLHNYKDRGFWEENPCVYIVTEAGSFRYRIYAAYEAEITGTTYWRDVDSELRRQEYVDYGLTHSVFDTGIVPDANAPVLTLSTCTGYTYARRWVVQAALEGQVIPPQE